MAVTDEELLPRVSTGRWAVYDGKRLRLSTSTHVLDTTYIGIFKISSTTVMMAAALCNDIDATCWEMVTAHIMVKEIDERDDGGEFGLVVIAQNRESTCVQNVVRPRQAVQVIPTDRLCNTFR
eukprot:CAMPEP_0175925622 /NCGR_PEP_ID=MMETSP0108-20121206/15744_1 /TAXON_ID=195067 ORGANISM="Goniomonas pacifica, Strain CCMP1869" /NCGR_SAMPLE_ID=MMETSP0108 /ASSEMBLY_ACC=CAM_ASM_000204 /LENGTH=122 /DNA_ID=CAMNT_0017248785 /DNA_START=228 /DNA_END=598 /DNA_ORIENTATION=-